MKALLSLAVVLIAACGVFLSSGLPAIQRMRQAHNDLLKREQQVTRQSADVAPVSEDTLAQLEAERAGLEDVVGRRRATLTGGLADPDAPKLEEELARRKLRALGPEDKLTVAVRAQAASSPQAEAALAAIVRALSYADDVEVSSLVLKNDGRLQPVPGGAGVQQVEAQVVLSAPLADALVCLEALAPRRDPVGPALEVQSCSLRRIEPDHWGAGAESLSGPPTRLSVSLAALFTATDGGAP